MSQSSQHKDHDAIVQDWTANAQEHDDANYEFLRSLKMRSPKKVDRLAQRIHLEVFEVVDCTRCANCCRTLQPVFTEQDIDRIAAHRGMTRDEFIANYLEEAEEGPGYRTKTTPCPLLGEDNKCTVYDVRPETCRKYPYTDQEDFVFRTMGHASNALVCPAVFEIVEEMKKRN
jgi:Fe-S-cluster containining protein